MLILGWCPCLPGKRNIRFNDGESILRWGCVVRKLAKNKALVVFSGGQDSSIALGWALERYDHVETIGFNYNQRHAVELGARVKIRSMIQDHFPNAAGRLGPDKIVNAGGLSDVTSSAMTRESEIETAENGLPTTFLPARNLMFLVLSAALAYERDLGVLVAGMCEVDYSGYPDCREETLEAQMHAIRLGTESDITLEAPLLKISKADSWHLAKKIAGEGFVNLVNEHSHSCYRGVRSKRHEWGYGCGNCPACELRKIGWDAYKTSV